MSSLGSHKRAHAFGFNLGFVEPKVVFVVDVWVIFSWRSRDTEINKQCSLTHDGFEKIAK